MFTRIYADKVHENKEKQKINAVYTHFKPVLALKEPSLRFYCLRIAMNEHTSSLVSELFIAQVYRKSLRKKKNVMKQVVSLSLKLKRGGGGGWDWRAYAPSRSPSSYALISMYVSFKKWQCIVLGQVQCEDAS